MPEGRLRNGVESPECTTAPQATHLSLYVERADGRRVGARLLMHLVWLLDQVEDLEHRHVEGDYHRSDDATQDRDHQRLDQ